MIAGDFTQVASAQCNGGTALTLPLPFVDNRVAPALFSPVALNLMQGVPVSTDPCGRTSFAVPDNNDEQQVVRAPRLPDDGQAAAVRSLLRRQLRSPAWLRGHQRAARSGNGLGLDNRVQTAVVADDYAISNTLLSSTRFALANSRVLRVQGDTHARPSPISARNVTPLVTEPGLAFYSLNVTNGFPGPGFPGDVRVHDLPDVPGLRLGQGRAPARVRRPVDPAELRRQRPLSGERNLHVQRLSVPAPTASVSPTCCSACRASTGRAACRTCTST